MGRLDNYNVYLHTYTLRYKQTQEKKSTLRCASLRGVEFFPHGKRGERGRSARWISSLESVYLKICRLRWSRPFFSNRSFSLLVSVLKIFTNFLEC